MNSKEKKNRFKDFYSRRLNDDARLPPNFNWRKKIEREQIAFFFSSIFNNPKSRETFIFISSFFLFSNGFFFSLLSFNSLFCAGHLAVREST